MDITMHGEPTAAEIQQAKLDQSSPTYYRFNWSAMHAMLLTMIAADAVVDEPPPEFPTWPPANTPAERKKVLDRAVWDPKVEATLTAAERSGLKAARDRAKKLRAVHSKKKGKVPAFKFKSNEGWIVASDECTVIATKLRVYAARASQQDLDAVGRAYEDSQAKLDAAITKGTNEVSLTPHGLGMSLDEYRAWINHWAAYNQVAAKHGGYQVD